MKLSINNIQQIKHLKKGRNSLNKYIKSLDESNTKLNSVYENFKELNIRVKEITDIQKSFNYVQYKDLHTLNVVKENMLLCIELQQLIDFINKKEKPTKNKKLDEVEMFIDILDFHKSELKDKTLKEDMNTPFSKTNIKIFMYLQNISIILKGVLKNRFYDSENITNLAHPDVIKAVNAIDLLLEDFLLIFVLKKLPKFLNLFNNKTFLFDNGSGGFCYLINLLETLDNVYIRLKQSQDDTCIDEEILNSQNVRFSNNTFGIYFDLCEKYHFFPINLNNKTNINLKHEISTKDSNIMLLKDIPEIIKCYKPIFLKNVILKTTVKFLNESLRKLSFKEIIEKIKEIQSSLIYKDVKLIYLNKIHEYLSKILIRDIKGNEILGLFEFNTEYIKILEDASGNSACIFGRDLITDKKSELLKRYVEFVNKKMKEWLSNIYSSIYEKYKNRESINSMNSDNKLVLSEFISISNIISEQIEPATFNIEIVETIANTIYMECDSFKNKLINLYEEDITNEKNNSTEKEGFFKTFMQKAISEKNHKKEFLEILFFKNQRNENKPGFEEYLIATINSSKAIEESCNSFPQIIEIQLLGDVFNSLGEKCISLLCLNICSLFYSPLENKYKNNILPSFGESNLLKKIPPTIKDFFNDYIEVMNSTSFDILFLKTVKKVDEIYFKQFIYFFPLNISFKNRKEFALKVLNRDLCILNSIYETDLKFIKEFIEAQSVEISLIELGRVIKRFGEGGLIKLFHEDIQPFEKEGFL